MSSKKKQDVDERFARVQKDPRFWEMPERERKVKIDKRFQSMFHDERFKVKYTVDKRGRPINHTSTEDLKRFYKLSDSEDEEDTASKKTDTKKKKKKIKEGEVKTDGAKGEKPERGVRVIEEDKDEEQQSDEDNASDLGEDATDISDDDDDEEEGSAEEEEGSDVDSGSDEEEESGLDSDDSDSGPDLARGKGNIETSSDEDDEDDEVDLILRREEEEIEHDWGELCKDAPRSDEVSTRLAVCNMDWDRMKAKDLLALFNSFVPKGGAVLSVKIFPSDFGKERLNLEATQGPMELRALPDDSEDDTEEEKVYREKMRDYQFKRLKYFYGVVECDSTDTAAKIYNECDGYEYESSCSVLDLRFIPNDITFDEEPKDVATDVNLTSYTPKLFTSSASSTSKVQLTWDETDHERVSALNRKFNKNELLDMDFNAYLASSSEEDEEKEDEGIQFGHEDVAETDQAEEPVDERATKEEKKTKKNKSEKQISKYRELLKGIQDKEKKLKEDKDMEMEITWVPGLKETTETLVKKKLEGREKMTPWEEFLQKKKDRRKEKKDRRKQAEETELSDDELPPDVDLNDPFFAEELAASDLKKKPKKNKKKQDKAEQRDEEEEEELERQKAEMALLMEDDAADAKHKHFNYDKIVEQQNLSKKKKKKLMKKGEQLPDDDHFQVDVNDPRFQAMFTSHLFNLDPSHPSYKQTKATQSILAEKQRRREQQWAEDTIATTTSLKATPTQEPPTGGKTDDTSAKRPMDPSLSLLVKSIKSKTEQFQARKKQKLI